SLAAIGYGRLRSAVAGVDPATARRMTGDLGRRFAEAGRRATVDPATARRMTSSLAAKPSARSRRIRAAAGHVSGTPPASARHPARSRRIHGGGRHVSGDATRFGPVILRAVAGSTHAAT